MDEMNSLKDGRKIRFSIIKSEFYLWYIFAWMPILYIIYQALTTGGSFDLVYLIDKYSFALCLSIFFILFPIFFNFIFMKYPFEFIRGKVTKTEAESSMNTLENIDSIDRQIKESTQIAERIYSNSRAYLMIGCVVSVAGVVVFNSPFLQASTTQSGDWTLRMFDLLPRFGALFFIEYIALFFFKQYRILLEDYRYYEAIKRDRQNIKLLLEQIEKHSANQDVLKIIIEYLNQHSVHIPTFNGDHKLQSEKALYDDMNLITKVTELITSIKK